MKAWLYGAVVAVCAAAIPSAYAHHSFASFDMTHVLVVKGTVKEFHYTNPHCWIVLMTKDPTGNDQVMSIEANGPGYLVKAGWNRNSLTPGENVTVSLNPMRDGTAGGSLVKVVFPDGHELNTHVF